MRQSESRALQARIGRALICGVAIWATLPRPSHAELAYGLGYVAEHSDNITRAPAGSEVSDRVNSYLVGLAYREDSPSLVANALVQGEYRDYVKDVHSDGPLYYVDASAVWTILPQQLTWTFLDRYDYGLLDPTLPYSPTNRTAEHVFDTGPDLRVALGPRNALTFGLRYGDVYYSDADTSHTRTGATIRWQYDVNSVTSWALNYELLELNYEHDVTNFDSRRQNYFVRYLMREGRSQMLIDVGGIVIDRDSAERVDGGLVRVSLTRALTSQSTARVLLGGEYTDAGSVLLGTATESGGEAGTGAVSEVVASDIFYAKRAELSYSWLGSLVGFDLQVFKRDLDYLVTLQDRRETGGELSITHNPQGIMSSGVFASSLKSSYVNGMDREDNQTEFGARLIYRATREISVALEGVRTRLISTFTNSGYDERRILLTLRYRSSPLFTPPPRR